MTKTHTQKNTKNLPMLQLTATLQTPIGPLKAIANRLGLTALLFTEPVPRNENIAKLPLHVAASLTLPLLLPENALNCTVISEPSFDLEAHNYPEQRLVPADPQSTPWFNADPQEYQAICQILTNTLQQLSEYFAKTRRHFSLPLAPEGSPFQQQVWQSLSKIDYGDTCSYADIANAIANPKAVRAVGAANGRNPLSIVIPCHRVVGQNGSMTGYAGGLTRKVWLLRHEKSFGPT